MKAPYVLFAGNKYHPAGGWNDFQGWFLNKEEALVKAASISCDWWHVVELVTDSVLESRIVLSGDRFAQM